MRKEQLYAKEHHPNRITKLPLAVIKSNPDVSAAAHSGLPDLKPPDDLISATDVLNQGAAGPTFSVVGATVTRSNGNGSGSDAGGRSSNSVETETVTSSDDSTDDPQPAANAAGTTPSATSSDPATTDNTNANGTTSQTPSTDASKSGTDATAPPSDPQSESTSKKKKGIHKVVPW
jgi:hypothetical protein